MKLQRTLLATAVALLAPFSVGAVTVHDCEAGAPASKSFKGDFQAEANHLFRNFQIENKSLESDASELETMVQEPGNNSWQAHTEALVEAKEHVNHMNDMLCRMIAIQKSVAPWQADLIARIHNDAILSAANVEEAILYLDNNRTRITTVGAPLYSQHLKSVYDSAHEMDKTISAFTSLAAARNKVRSVEETGK